MSRPDKALGTYICIPCQRRHLMIDFNSLTWPVAWPASPVADPADSEKRLLQTNAKKASRWRCFARYAASALFSGTLLMPLAGHAEQPEYAPQQAVGEAGQIQIDAGKATETVFSATNAYRTENKIRELTWNNPLWQAAQEYAEFLAANKASGHEADGKTPQQRADEKGFRCPVVENVYSADPAEKLDDEETAALQAFEIWKSSTPENDDMLSPINVYTGVGAAAWNHDGQIYYVFVQMLGRECGGGQPAPVMDPPPSAPDPGYVEPGPSPEPIPIPVPVCPAWDPDCHGCPVWNPYCHKCPPWDPDCRKCPSWNPYCHKCPPWDADCRKCPPWNLNCHKCPSWNPNCHRCPPSNPNCNSHKCPNGGIWPHCKIPHVCPNGGTWPHCNPPIVHICPNGGTWPRCNPPIGHVCLNGGIWPRCNVTVRVCPNGGVWPSCNPKGSHFCPNGGIWPRCRTTSTKVCANGGVWPNCRSGGTRLCPNGGSWPRCRKVDIAPKHKLLKWYHPQIKRPVGHSVKQFNQRRNFQRRLDTMRRTKIQHFVGRPHHR